jgi:hypothetical protein
VGPTTTTTLPPTLRFSDGGDGTIADLQTGLVWETKDDGGGLHDADNLYVWSGVCDQGEALDEVLCQPSQAAADACKAQGRGAVGCRVCPGICEISPFAVTTIWDWLVKPAGDARAWAMWEPAIARWLYAALPIKRMLELARADATAPFTASAGTSKPGVGEAPPYRPATERR